MRYILPVIFIFLLFNVIMVSGQISHGGYPMDVSNLKSTSFRDNIVIMPKEDFLMMRLESLQTEDQKSLKFAHTFNVSLTPDNSGIWYEIDGFNVWQLAIKSENALSLNVFFSKYHVPSGARLFVFDSEKKRVLGAFTNENNKSYNKLAIYPVPGDEIIIQYEEPQNPSFKGELEVGEINHDYIGILNLKNRWDRRPSDSCHVDVNCEFASQLDNQKQSVCRIFAGDEIGTGTLINNVLENGKPYLISAYHVFDDPSVAEKTIYDFNYESPSCTEIDGFDNQSVSGSTALAWFDSLDFIFVELSEVPPATYRPYYSGWDVTQVCPSNTYTIHHPNGDVKKISHDEGECDSARYSKKYLEYGHWKVFDWETGTTEGGSSGSALYNESKRVVGTLSGGNASCSRKSYDLFARLDKMWNYKSQNNRQLKRWLDPGGTGKLVLDGLNPYEAKSEECSFICNFLVEDSIALLPDFKSTQGIYSGNNSMSISEVSERFTGIDKAVLSGVAIGLSDFAYTKNDPNANVTIRIYTGDTIPVFAVKQFKYSMNDLTENAMNFFSFSEPVEVEGNFFVSVVIPSDNDSIAVYQSGFRTLVAENTMLVKQNGLWKDVNTVSGDKTTGASLLMQVLVCNASFSQTIDTIFKSDQTFRIFPNPANDYIVVEFKDRAPIYNIDIYDMTGKVVLNDCAENRMFSEISLTGIIPGIYFIKVTGATSKEVKKFVVTRNL